jgi:hypothetical protein
MPLPQLAIDLEREGRAPLTPQDITAIDQTLDLWSGTVISRYAVDGRPVTVVVACDPGRDAIAVRIASPLVAAGKLGVRLALPRGHELKVKNNPGLDWSQPD